MKTLDVLTALTNTSSLEDLWGIHTECMKTYGFDRLLYGYTQFLKQSNVGDPEDFVILSSLPRSYVEDFVFGGMFFDAPMVQWALNNDGPASWGMLADELANGHLSDKAQAVLDYNHKNGVSAGYTVSFKASSSRVKGSIALVGKEGLNQADLDEIWREHGQKITLLNNVAHLKIITLPYSGYTRTLTARQREVLEWVSDGKSVQDIALLLKRTPATIEKHLRLAREILKVETTAQAVLKASFLNQIFLRDK